MKSSVRVLAAIALVGVLGVGACGEKETRDGARTSSAARHAAGHDPDTAATTAAGAPPSAATARRPRTRSSRRRRRRSEQRQACSATRSSISTQRSSATTRRPALQKDVEWMKRWTTTKVMVEGHCDSRGTAEYNLALGERRAKAVQDYLVSLGVAGRPRADRQQGQGTAVLQRRERSLLAAESPRPLHDHREVVARPAVPRPGPQAWVVCPGRPGLRTWNSGLEDLGPGL